ncbi:TrmJ/YjtD family RNA methyltransferase, partial [Vibrio diazotrophicus]|uniref:TrmJ/YjtD family RNA methyltransferase n=2 Tax=Vibrio TaxID=662 RepID=UPI00142D846A
MLSNVKVVLVGTSHSGNIGSAARAMKVMGLSEMVLVDPQCEVDAQAVALAAGASDIALNARIVSSLEEAVEDCGLVVGSSARSRTLEWPMLDPRECGEKFAIEGQKHPVALVFGRERTGLTNEELQTCHYHVCIPANPEYSSLNLAMAVQTICYEIRIAHLNQVQSQYAPQADEEYPRH